MQEKTIIGQPNQRVWRWHSKYRYYTVYLQQNLFGEWTITQSWGGLKNRLGGYKVITFMYNYEAINYLEKLIMYRIKRGYNDMVC